MERQNIFTGIKVLSGQCRGNEGKQKQKVNENADFLSVKDNNIMLKSKSHYKVFKFDCCLGKNSTQQQVYDNFCLSMVQDYIQGYDCTLIICGDDNKSTSKSIDILLGKETQETKGLLPRFIDHLISSTKYFSQRKFLVKTSFLQINNQQPIDLLAIKKCRLQIKQGKTNKNEVLISNLLTKPLQKIDQIESFYLVGNRKRQYAYSKQYRKRENSTSFFTVYLQSLEENKTTYRSSKFTFCQLSRNSFQEFQDLSMQNSFQKNLSMRSLGTSKIQNVNLEPRGQLNLSNYAFQNVINTLVYGEQTVHVPFGDSKVTKLLRQSLGGNNKVCILGLVDVQNQNYFSKVFKMLNILQKAAHIQNSPSNLKELRSSQGQIQNESLVGFLEQIHRLSNAIDKAKIELQILIGNSEYVQKEVQKLREQNGNSLIKDNEFCSEEHLQDHVLEQKTKKQWQLKQNIKALQKNLRQKISYILNLNQDEDLIENNKVLQEEVIISKRKEILLRIKSIKQQRLINMPSIQLQPMQRQIRKQIFGLQIEFQKQRNLYTQTIRSLQGKLSFYRKVAQHYLKSDQMEIIRFNSKFDQTKRQYQIPMFMIKDKKPKPGHIISPAISQRKFIVSPRSKSYNSYHSISVSKSNTKGQPILDQNNIEKIRATKLNVRENYHSQYQTHKKKEQSNFQQKLNEFQKISKSRQIANRMVRAPKSPIHFKKIGNFQSRTGTEQNSNYIKNVKSEYQIQDINMDRVIKFNQERKLSKSKEKLQKFIFEKKDNYQSSPNILIKRQKLNTEPVPYGIQADNYNDRKSPQSFSQKNMIVKSPFKKIKRWV